MPINYDQTTDTHLAKKYNDALFDCMMRCNMTGFVTKSAPHLDNLISYYSAVDTFFTNTFFLFEAVGIPLEQNPEKKESISMRLMKLSNELAGEIKKLKTEKQYQQYEYFFEVLQKISYMHKMIMFGLQQRQMLVRMSEKDPIGQESINYWNQKTGFKKGGLDL
jgi:hypothetical protein